MQKSQLEQPQAFVMRTESRGVVYAPFRVSWLVVSKVGTVMV